MTYTWWDAGKDFLGALGPILIAIPWFRDFLARGKSAHFADFRAQGKLERLKADLVLRLREKIERPRAGDFGWTVLGLACITASFLIAFVRGLRDLT